MAKIKRLLFGSTWTGRMLRLITLFTVLAYPFSYHYKFVYIDGISMKPTYNDGQWSLEQRRRSLGNNWTPDRFDVVTVWSDKDECKLCKRVIGLPGEKVEVKEGRIFINGSDVYDSFGKGKMIYRQLMDPDTNEPWWTEYENIDPVLVQPGHMWIIGDNRGDSVFGHFPINEIHGKIVLY